MLVFKDLPDCEKPRERLLLYGASKLSNEELLMIILRNGTRKYSVKELAVILLSRNGGISKFREVTFNRLIQIEGIGKVKAIELVAVVEFAKRLYMHTTDVDLIRCTDPVTIINYFNSLFIDKKQEEFYVLYLDNKKKYLEKKKLFVGSINSSIVHPREIFKNAYLMSASYFICVHNHPSGDPTPSMEDIRFTKKLYELGSLHAIQLIDHIIIGKNCYYSFYEDRNILNNNT